jgi:cyclophilin family peptidyl-prolyl cis-trans isomerase
MQRTWKLLIACSMLAALFSSAGCGSGTDGDAEANAAATDDPSGQAGNGGAAQSGELGSTPLAASSSEPGAAAGSLRPAVVIETSLGKITVELDKEKAPTTVSEFLRRVESGYYDGTIFHKVWKGAVILGGSYTEDLTEKPAGPAIPNEADNGLNNERGTIAMAREPDVINSATAQFFINVKDNPNYDHQPGAQETLNPEDYGYCVFGRVAPESMDVVDKIADVEVEDTSDLERFPVQTVRIESVRKIR